jgi:hypothetical protein
MKKYILLMGIVLFSVVAAQAQRFERKRDEIKQRVYERRVEFIKDKVPMTREEENAFWPTYNDYNLKKEAIKERVRDSRKNQRKEGVVDYERMNDQSVQMLVDEANLYADYYHKLKKLLPAQKIHLLFEAEKDFKKQLLDKVSGSPEPRD